MFFKDKELKFDPIYEIKLDGRIVTVDFHDWKLLSDYVNDNIWFFLIHKGSTYKYIHAQTFFDRPTRYDFQLVMPGEETPIRYVYI